MPTATSPVYTAPLTISPVAGTTRSGNSQNWCFAALAGFSDFIQKCSRLLREIFKSRNSSCHTAFFIFIEHKISRDLITHRKITGRNQVIDHSLQAHSAAIVGRIDTSNPVAVKFFDLLRKDGSSSSAKDLDMSRSFFFEQIKHVLKKFHMTALIGSDCDSLYVFLNGAVDNFLYRTIMSEVNHFTARRLDDSAHDINRCIVSVKKRGGGDDPDVVFGFVNLSW